MAKKHETVKRDLPTLDYYYGLQSEQFSFFRIPRMFFTDSVYKSMLPEAKILYGLLLDRMSLSMRNGWLDAYDRVYIFYTLEEVMEELSCGHTKGVALFSELEEYGLIERVKQGMGRPTIIYLKNFAHHGTAEYASDVFDDEEHTESEVIPAASVDNDTEIFARNRKEPENAAISKTSEKRKSGLPHPVPTPELMTSGKRKSGLPENGSHDFQKTEPNYNYKRYTERDISIYPSEEQTSDAIDTTDATEVCKDQFREQIEYDSLIAEGKYEKAEIDALTDLAADVLSATADTTDMVRIGRADTSVSSLRNRILLLTADHIRYILDALHARQSHIRNIRSYLLTALYNAPSTYHSYLSFGSTPPAAGRAPTYDLEAYKQYDFFAEDEGA